MNPPHVSTREDLIVRISAEYLEMPGLRLTLRQALRLWGLDEPTCAAALDALLKSNFLSRRGDGSYVRTTDGQASPVRFPVMSADRQAGVAAARTRKLRRHEN